MVCEQINFWASGYKHAAKHMNQTRFNFFFLIIFNEFNVIRCKGRNQIYEPFKSTVKIMILSRYRYRPVIVPLPSHYRPVTVPLPFFASVIIYAEFRENAWQKIAKNGY